MHNCWFIDLTISGAKNAIDISEINIIEFLCDYNEQWLKKKKIIVIMVWSVPGSIKKTRAFVGIIVYYRIFIIFFAIIAASIFQLFRKDVDFSWIFECQSVMNELKRRLTEIPILITLDFSSLTLIIFLNIDVNILIEWDEVLSQLQSDGQIWSTRFESEIWNLIKLKYDIIKLKYQILLKALKKFRFWLYKRYFIIETNTQILI